MSDQVGDFCKTAVLLACGILESSRPLIPNHSPNTLIQGIDLALRCALAYMDGQRRDASSEEVKNAAVSAANGVLSSATPVIDAMKKVGASGLINVEQGSGGASTVEFQEGMQFDRGYLSRYFVTDPVRDECVLESPSILVHEGKISSMKDLLGLLESVVRAGKSLLVIAEDVEGEALATLVVNKLRGTIQCAAVRSPAFADRRVSTLEDIAIITGAKFMSRDLGMPLSSVRLEDLGSAKTVRITQHDTAIFDGAGDARLVEERVNTLRREIQSTVSDFERAKLQERLARISGGIAIIRTGGLIAQEYADERYRIVSALRSAYAVIEEGWIPGGGVTLLNASRSLESLTGQSEGANAGIGVMRSALEAPIRALISTTSESPTKVLNDLKVSQSGTMGFNVQQSALGDLWSAGILDPLKSVRLALTLAVAHAKAILQTGTWELEDVQEIRNV